MPPTCLFSFRERCSHPELGGDATAERCASCAKYRGHPRGLGDVIDRAAHILKLKVLAEQLEKVTGKPCGCLERRAAMNAAFPFDDKQGEVSP